MSVARKGRIPLTIIAFVLGAVVIILLTLIIMLNIKKQADVSYLPDDLTAACGMVADENYEQTGSIIRGILGRSQSVENTRVEGEFTSAVLSAFLNRDLSGDDVLYDIRINFINENEIEMSAVIGTSFDRYLTDNNIELPSAAVNFIELAKGKSVYIKFADVKYEGENHFSSTIEKLSVGLIGYPGLGPGFDSDVNDYINSLLDSSVGLEIEKFEQSGGSVYLEGSIPEYIK